MRAGCVKVLCVTLSHIFKNFLVDDKINIKIHVIFGKMVDITY